MTSYGVKRTFIVMLRQTSIRFSCREKRHNWSLNSFCTVLISKYVRVSMKAYVVFELYSICSCYMEFNVVIIASAFQTQQLSVQCIVDKTIEALRDHARAKAEMESLR